MKDINEIFYIKLMVKYLESIGSAKNAGTLNSIYTAFVNCGDAFVLGLELQNLLTTERNHESNSGFSEDELEIVIKYVTKELYRN